MRVPSLLTFCLLAWTAPLLAQDGARASGEDGLPPVPTARAVRVDATVRVDGRLDEAVWADAPAVTEFTQLDPHEGEPASERTEVRILHDDVALYIGARLYDRSPVSTRLGRRDMPFGDSDWLTVIFDSNHDHRTAFGFEVNPSGVRRDQTRAGESEDDSWEPVWEAATSVDEEGWTAELRIPFSQLRFNPTDEQVWGIQLERTIARLREFSQYSFTPRTQPGGIPRYGHLEGLSSLRTGKRLEVLPYTVARAEYADRSGNPFRTDEEYDGDFGVDLKYRLTSNLTLDATINPDFGQVEVDPAEVNLTAFETRYREKRPFFIEGSELFDFGSGGGNTAFYSRRIGRAPQLRPPYAQVDVPDAARIVGAAKLTGRTANGWSVGVLNAVARREEARYRTVEDPALDHRMTVEPRTNYFVGRLRKDFRAGQSVIGGMFAAVNRDLDPASDSEADVLRLRSALRSAAYTGGVEFSHEWAGRTWSVYGFASGSYVTGSREAITATQRNAPWHYFGRPDADHLEVDPEATSLAGLSAQTTLSHRVGRHWSGSISAGTTTPAYEVNDLGFQYRADRIDGQANLRYAETRPGDFLRRWQVGGQLRAERNYDFETIMNLVSVNAFFQNLDYWGLGFGVNRFGESLDDRLTRGGPAARRPASTQVFAHLDTDGRKPYVFGIFGVYDRHVEGGWSRYISGSIEVKPASSWNFEIGPAVAWSHSGAQYLGAVADPLAAATFGRRYLFAELDQTTVSMETRLNVTFKPGLTLQIFAQPFLSSAEFDLPAELRAPNTYDFPVYGEDVGTREDAPGGYTVDPDGAAGPAEPFLVPDRDFNLRSLRGNAVLRWEWRPGSTLYLVWQQDRSDVAPVGDFDFGRDRSALFRAPADDVLVLKVNYWLNP